MVIQSLEKFWCIPEEERVSTHVQEFNPLSLHEVNLSVSINLNSTNCDDLIGNKLPSIAPTDKNLNLPIAFKNDGTTTINWRLCTNCKNEHG